MSLTSERMCEILKGFCEPSSYSGRGMYGERCMSVSTTGDQSAEELLAGVIEGCSGIKEAAEVVRSVKQESLGLGWVLYWPEIKFDHDDADQDDE